MFGPWFEKTVQIKVIKYRFTMNKLFPITFE